MRSQFGFWDRDTFAHYWLVLWKGEKRPRVDGSEPWGFYSRRNEWVNIFIQRLRREKKKRGKNLKVLRDLITNTVRLDTADDIELFNAKTLTKDAADDDIQDVADNLIRFMFEKLF